jgi:hypothetical protein
MELKTVIILSCLFVFALFIIYLTYKVYYLQKPSPGSCDALRQTSPSVKWSADCSYVQELKLDSSIPTPKIPLYLSSFTNSPGSGPAWGVNVWYRYRYVNGNTGNYGNFSPWTITSISSGKSNLPCKNSTDKTNGCPSSFQKIGKDSCQSNLPTLNLDGDTVVNLTNGMYINVHRYVADSTNQSPPSDSSSDKIVGMMIPQGNSGNFMFIDVSESPCKEMSCNNVVGC